MTYNKAENLMSRGFGEFYTISHTLQQGMHAGKIFHPGMLL